MRVRAPDPQAADIAAAEAWEAGALGVVEESDDSGAAGSSVQAGSDLHPQSITIYLPADRAEMLTNALRVLDLGLVIEGAEEVVDRVWSETWKEVLEPVEVSPRLVVAPSFAPVRPQAGQGWISIEPGQAFGTGAHHSTRLALEGIDALLERAGVVRVLDVGTGSGVLALAAVALGAERAVGFDLDRLAGPAARAAGLANGLESRVDWYVGPIEALGSEDASRFDLVVANLLRSELLPIAEQVAGRVARGGSLVLAGLLEADGAVVGETFGALGLRERERRSRRDDDGESWLGLTLER